MRHLPTLALASALSALPGVALAHAGEGGFVLLLPTGVYSAAGVAAVALTVLAVSLLPAAAAMRLFAPVPLWRCRGRGWRRALGPAGFLAFAAVMALGLAGPRDPGRNLLPLAVWVAFWAGMPVLQALAGDLWRHLNPWTWPVRLARRAGLRPRLRLPGKAAPVIALASFLGFAAVLLAHPAPTDPARLAVLAGSYWVAHLAGALACGPRWLRRAEGLSVLLAAYARLAPLAPRHGRCRLGLPGWQIARGSPPPGTAMFVVAMLAVGSFDGLNETFLWIGALGLTRWSFRAARRSCGRTLPGWRWRSRLWRRSLRQASGWGSACPAGRA